MSSSPRPSLPFPALAPLTPPEGFVARLAAIGVTVAPGVIEQLGAYLALLLAMNEQMNLTGIKAPDEAWEKHGLDALTLLPLLAALPAGARLVDIGSGGGIPGIPLAIARPDLHVTLVEATQKKAAFLADAASALGLAHVLVIAERAETLATGELRGTFDVVTARAVAPLVKLVPLTAPFARAGGTILLIKGQRADEELAAAALVLNRQRCAHKTTIATPTGRIVVLRRAGTPHAPR